MIKAQKSRQFTQLFHLYNERLLKKSFYRVYLQCEMPPPTRGSTLYIANHSSWWDGLIAFYLTKKTIQQDCYAMMTEEGLNAYPFFRKLGGFSINKTNPKDVIRSLSYTKQLLEASKAVWIFPQGAEYHLEKRPLEFEHGVSHLVMRIPDVQVIPITFYYTFLHEQKPEVFIKIGQKFDSSELVSFNNKRELTLYLERVVTNQLNQQRQAIIEDNFSSYNILLKGRKNISETFKTLFHK